jgi:PKD repeat protein
VKSIYWIAVFFLANLGIAYGQTCDFTFSPTSAQCAGAEITFDALPSSDSSALYLWNFGDSTAIDTGLQVLHEFPIDSVDQTYTVQLTVIDSSGSCTISYPITALAAPDLQLTGIMDLCLPNLNCNDPFTPPPYTITSSSGNVSAYGPFSWDFGDGSPTVDTTATSLTHTYQQFGTYRLTITANGAACPSIRQRIKFYREPDQPLLTLPITDACEGDTVVATISHNQCPGNEEYYLLFWDFPNTDPGLVDTLYAPGQSKHVYDFSDNVACNSINGSVSPEVRVWVVNPCFPADESINASWNATSAQVDVAPHPIFNLPADPLCWPGDSVYCFDNQSCPNLFLDTLSFEWTFGDPASGNNSSTDETPCHTFSGPGSYNITLTAENTGCGMRSSTQTLVIEETPQAAFSYTSVNAGCVPEIITIVNASTPPADLSYDWSISPDSGFIYVNGTTDSSANPEIQFDVPGDYWLSMLIETPHCGMDSMRTLISIKGPPIASLLPLSDSCGTVVYYPQALVDSQNNSLTYVQWNFGPNATPQFSSSLDPGPVSFDPDPNTVMQVISLMVGNSCDTLVLQDTFLLNGVAVIDAGPDTTLCQGDSAFCPVATPLGGQWLFQGNLSTNFCFSPIDSGDFEAVYIYDSLGCSFYDTVHIKVTPYPQVVAADIELCLGDSVLLSAQPGGGVWFGNGLVNGNTFSQDTAGVYPLTYLYTDPLTGCSNPHQVNARVRDLPQVNAGGFITYCVTGATQSLPTATPSGGSWSGPGVVDPNAGTFNPMSVGVGTYSLLYSYTDGFGCYAEDSLQVYVINVPTVDAGANDSLCAEGAPIFLSGQTSTAPGVWIGTGVVDSLTGLFDPMLAGAGSHLVNYCVGVGDCRVCDSRTVVVQPSPVVTALPDSFCLGSGPIDLSANGLLGGSPVAGVWSGNGVSLSGGSYYFNASTAGTYHLVFEYTDPNSPAACSGSDSTIITVFPNPLASFPIPANACMGYPVSFANTSTGATSYLWSFGDPANGSSSLFEPDYTYADTGSFAVSLIAISNRGCRDTAFQSIEVSLAPIPLFTLSDDTACAQRDILPGMDGIAIHLTDQSTATNGVYFWDFGGGQTVSGQTTFAGANPPTVYFPQGALDTTYTVQLTLGNDCDTFSYQQSVTVKPLPRSLFAPEFGTFCSPYIPKWANISTGVPTSFEWYLDDFSQLLSTDSLPTNIILTYYGSTDTTYTIIMVAENECGRDTGYQQITVLPNDLDAFFNTSQTQGCDPLTVNFSSFAGAPLSSFDFGDGTGVNAQSATHTFNHPGTYFVSHLVSNGCSRDTDTVAIFVYPSAELAINPQQKVVCPGEVVLWRDTSGNAGNINYIWSFGNGDTVFAKSPTYVFPDPGNYLSL